MRFTFPVLVTAAFACAVARADTTPSSVYDRAVEWLASQQHDNGGFAEMPGEGKGELGITCLVIKAFAEAPPETREELAPALEKAVAYVLRHQQADGSFSQGRSGLQTYRTAVAIQALVAHDKARHREAIARAAEWLKGGQADEGEGIAPSDPRHGGFSYGPAGSGGRGMANLSNTHMALAALHEAGIPPDDPVFQRAMVFLRRCQNLSELNDGAGGIEPLDDGGFMYLPFPGRDEAPGATHPSYAGMTYAGLMSLMYAGASEDDPMVQAALRWIRVNYTLDENRGLGARDGKPGQAGLYYYYYTFAKCLNARGEGALATDGGERRWANDLFEALAARQKPDGSFQNTDGQWWESDPVLCTAYCINAMNWARPYLER